MEDILAAKQIALIVERKTVVSQKRKIAALEKSKKELEAEVERLKRLYSEKNHSLSEDRVDQLIENTIDRTRLKFYCRKKKKGRSYTVDYEKEYPSCLETRRKLSENPLYRNRK